jgi:hypothetical protein
VSATEMNSLSTNEAIQANLIYTAYRDQLLRMAPWNCGVAYANLVYLTSTPGTPENTSPYTALWTPGQPPYGYAYEYLYPDDCLRMCFLIPSLITGFSGGVPIYPIPTSLGTAPTLYQGPAIKYKVQLDQYFRASLGTPAIVYGGSGYQAGDILICGGIPSVLGSTPAGLVNLLVNTVADGVITGISLVNFTNLDQNSLLYAVPGYNLNQAWTSGLGSGAIVSVSGVGATTFSARTVLTNQEYALAAYVKQVTDSSVMDSDFIEAWLDTLAGGLVNALTGDKALANQCIGRVNIKVEMARKNDGNEGLTVNDVTPDWMRIRGIDFPNGVCGAWNGFDWGDSWPLF